MSQYKTPNLVRRKKLKMYFRIGLVIVFVATLFYGISFWSKQESTKINKVNVIGNKYIKVASILEDYYEISREKFLFIIDRDNFVFLPRTEIVEEIKEELSVRAVYVKMSGLRSVDIEIVEFDPVAFWCADPARKNCYFINSDGKFFVKTPETIFSDLIEITADLKGEVLGTNYVDAEIFNNFIKLQTLLKKINIVISKITTNDYETFILSTKNGPQIYIDRKDDPVEVANNLKTAIEQESIHEIQLQNIQYFDLRFSGKAYYKIK